MLRLDGKSIIITGAGSGIGEAAAMHAAQEGARVTIADVNEAAGNAVVARIVADGGEAQFVRTDVMDEGQVEGLVAAAVSRFGGLHGAFNNAGVPGFSARDKNSVFTRIADFSIEAFHSGFDVNVFGTFFCMKHEIRAMLKAGGGGAIVNTASTCGILAIPGSPDYVAAKHAVIGLTKAVALDYAKEGIRVNAVLPGIIRTPMLETSFEGKPEYVDHAVAAMPIGRLGKPMEIAQAAMWLLSDEASLMTGASMTVDGGQSID